jgi:sugar phosphate isomerase/epimerase
MEKESPYKVGISTGFWYIGKDPALLGLATKISGLGATAGVQFLQIDLESIAEFKEPEVMENVKKMMTKLKIPYVGLHGEIGEVIAVDSAEKKVWDQTHDRLCQAVYYAAKMGFIYVNIHSSVNPILSLSRAGEAQRFQGYFYPVVGPDGRSLKYFIDKDEDFLQNVVTPHLSEHMLRRSETWRKEAGRVMKDMDEEMEKMIEDQTRQKIDSEQAYRKEHGYPPLSDVEKERIMREVASIVRPQFDDSAFERRMRKRAPKIWTGLKDTEIEAYQLEDGEFGAFFIVAHHMKKHNDYLWNTIAEGKDPDDLYFENEQKFCAAVSAKYLEGHLNAKSHWANRILGGMSIKEWCEKNKLQLLFENPEANRGNEGANRLFHPQHIYHAIKNVNSPYVNICIDVEHMTSHALDPDKEIPALPGDVGKYVYLWHLGQAVPYGGTAHIPINRGSNAQEQIYRWMYDIRKKGWKSGFILFERGGGRSGSGRQNYEVFEDSVLALRQIADYLEKDIPPRELPPEFYGISAANKGVWARQVVIMKEHAWDPIEGLLSVPEEKHTFLGKSAVDKGKAQEWEKRKYR